MANKNSHVAPQGAGACGGPGNRTPAPARDRVMVKIEKKEEEERRRRYEEWRMKNLGSCYAAKLDYEIGRVVIAEIGREMLQVLKPGDRVLIAFDPDEDPCFASRQTADGYVPLYGWYCRCQRSDFDEYAIIRLPLYMRGPLPTYRYMPSSPDDLITQWYYLKHNTLVVARYDGNKFDIVSGDDYDYFLAALFYFQYTDYSHTFGIELVEGATWYGVYSWWDNYIYNLNNERVAEFNSLCCDEEMHIIIMLIRRETETKFIYRSDSKKYEVVISTTQFPPVVSARRVK